MKKYLLLILVTSAMILTACDDDRISDKSIDTNQTITERIDENAEKSDTVTSAVTTASAVSEITTSIKSERQKANTTVTSKKQVQTGTTTKEKTTTTTPQQASSDFAAEVVRLVNVERKNRGLGNVTLSGSLSQAATKRSNEIMISFSHDRPDGTSCFTVLKEFGITYMSCGENIAYGQKTPQEVMTAWMNSDDHRANILNASFKKLGAGAVRKSTGNQVYWTQLFTD